MFMRNATEVDHLRQRVAPQACNVSLSWSFGKHWTFCPCPSAALSVLGCAPSYEGRALLSDWGWAPRLSVGFFIPNRALSGVR